MTTRKTIKGATGILYSYDEGPVPASYTPIVCLTNTSIDRSANTTEKTSYCTQGETETTVDSISTTVNFDAEIVIEGDLSDDGNWGDATGYNQLVTIMDSEEEHFFKIEGRDGDQFFTATITNLSDTFPGEGVATFSGTLNINGEISATDPKA